MSNAIAIVAESGAGKTASLGSSPELGIKGVDPKETFIINVKGKPLSFRNWKKYYVAIPSFESGPPKTGNYFASTVAYDIIRVISYINENRPDIKNVVLDDFQYIMAEEFMEKALKAGFEKFNKMAKNAYDVINAGINMKEEVNFVILTHSDSKETSFETTYKMKTIGNMLDNKVTLEGLFTVVLYAKQTWNEKEKKVSKHFVTNYDGQYPAKSPVGMFESTYILNDLGLVLDAVQKYNHGE